MDPSSTKAELQNRIRQQEIVADIGQRALEAEDLDELMNEVTEMVAETLDTEYCHVLELMSDGRDFFLRQGVGWQEGVVGNAIVPPEQNSQAGYTLLSQEPVIVDDLRTEDRFTGNELLIDHDIVSGITVLIGSIEAPWGILGTFTTEHREFTEHDATFIQSVANVLASAIENQQTTRDLELFRTLLDHSTDSVLVIDPETGQFLDINETTCRRRDYSREEFLQLRVPDIETEFPDQQAWHSFREDLKTKAQITFDGSHRRKDGTTYPVEVNATYVELDREYVLAMVRDVTERRERERKLQQYRAFTQAANDVIVTIDERSMVKSVNPIVSEVFGYDQEALVGESLTTLMPDELADRHREAITRYLETGEQTLHWDYIELPGQHADGSELPLAVSFGEATFEDERYFTGIIRDITERKEIQRQLEASNERLEQFASAVSHDLREPLRMVSNYLQLVENRYADDLDEDAEEFIDYAVDGAERMRAMIEGLLEYSRVETQGDSLEPIDLDTVLDDVIADLQLQIEESNAEITAEELPRVQGDATQLRQVFQNLLSNAIEYSGDEQPRIQVSAERKGSEWHISVRDEGIGIDPEDADRVFEVFQRLHSQDEHEGSGIGLALCQRIVERHGGEITVESEPGEGSTFSFRLPATSGDNA